uniref:39S ribosomal protein L16, mitochondrial n=1 Tax=Biomphalaria glabrata TaxID=6526 RepID=A0A2C9LIG0_BIOGL
MPAFGSIALKSLECCRMNGDQIDSARKTINRFLKRKGKLWIRIYPNIPVSKKPTDVRMGKDNSGASLLRCIGIPGGSKKKFAKVGDLIVVSVIATISKRSSSAVKVKKGTVHNAVIVRLKKKVLRQDGTTVAFFSNAAVLVNKQFEPLATRLFGPVDRDVRDYGKIFSMARE